MIEKVKSQVRMTMRIKRIIHREINININIPSNYFRAAASNANALVVSSGIVANDKFF